MNKILLLTLWIFSVSQIYAQEWYEIPQGQETRWISFENPEGKKGGGGAENHTAKGHAFDQLKAGETISLLDIRGAGIIKRIWLTINDRSPEMLRSLKIGMYWDGADKPAVSAPLGDFFGAGLGKMVAFESELFSDPEGRSFNCFIPMPFKKGAKVTLTNESGKDLTALFYNINLIRLEKPPKQMLYFHTYWHRVPKTELAKDFEILPSVAGKGRFLGVSMGVIANEIYQDSWWGEGEVKMYIDGDVALPTLVGTGTEDYIGTAWGQGTFSGRYQGALVSDPDRHEYAFYRYHIPDPVYFSRDIKVTIQQIGGWQTEKVLGLIQKEVPLIPVSVQKKSGEFVKLYEKALSLSPDLHDPEFSGGWVNFYREDDVSATAYFYLDSPENNLPAIGSVDLRIAKIPKKK